MPIEHVSVVSAELQISTWKWTLTTEILRQGVLYQLSNQVQMNINDCERVPHSVVYQAKTSVVHETS